MNRRTVDKARKARDKISDQIFALAPNDTTRFWDCCPGTAEINLRGQRPPAL